MNMENYQDYYADLDDIYPDQQLWKTVQKPSKGVQEPVQDVQNAVQKPFLRYRQHFFIVRFKKRVV